jgi:hypothetical protein
MRITCRILHHVCIYYGHTATKSSGAEPIWLRQFHFICYSHDLHILLVLRLPIHLKGELGNILYVIDLIRIAEDSGNFLKS